MPETKGSQDAALAADAVALATAGNGHAAAALPIAESGFERSLDRLFATRAQPHSRRDSIRRRGLAISDLLAIGAALALVGIAIGPHLPLAQALAVVAALPAWILTNKLLGLYDRDANLVHKSTLDELPRIVQSVALASGVLLLAGPPLGLAVSRAQVVLLLVVGVVFVAAGRSLTRWLVRLKSTPERMLIVGSGTVARLVARKVRAHPEYGVEVVGFVDVEHDGSGHHDGELLGDIHAFEELCREYRAERIVVAFSSLSHEHLLDVIRVSKLLNVKITVVPRLFEIIGGSVEIDDVEGMTLLGLRGLGRTRSSLAVKRAIDLLGAAVGLVVLAPALVAIAIAIKLDSKGPVLFAQRRIGRGAEPFRMFKLRTMVHDADRMKEDLAHLNEAELPMFKIKDDPRITQLGRVLRRTSLDEVPQLINVLRGEMSLVGPRPLVPEEAGQVLGWHRARLDLTPGLTGPWQVLGRTRIPFQEMVTLDYLYVNDWTVWNDIKLLLRTGPVVLKRSGH